MAAILSQSKAIFGVLGFSLLALQPKAHAEEANGYAVHRYHNPASGYLNAYLVETSGNLVLIDAGFGEIDGLAIRAMVDQIGKPVAAVLLTHAHIDHYSGVGYIVDPEVPVISSAGVRRHYQDWDPIYAARIPLPDNRRGPNRILADGEAILFDEVSFRLHEAGPGESYDDVWWMVEGAGRQVTFVGDLAMFGIPPFAQSGHTTAWLRSLDRLHDQIDEGVPVYLGHDSRPSDATWAPFDRAVLEYQADYLQAFRNTVADAVDGEGNLSDSAVEAVTARMAVRAEDPNYGFLTTLTARIVAGELLVDAHKAAMEVQLQAALSRLNE